MNSDSPSNSPLPSDSVVISLLSPNALRWSMWRFQVWPLLTLTTNVTGPNCSVILPGTQAGPCRRFLAITCGPMTKSLCHDEASVRLVSHIPDAPGLVSVGQIEFKYSCPGTMCTGLPLWSHEVRFDTKGENSPTDAVLFVHHGCQLSWFV